MFNLNSEIDYQTAYTVFIVIGSSILLFWGLKKLKGTEKERLQTAEQMEITEAIETDVFDEDTESITRKRAVSSIEARFELIRKAFIPIIIFLAAFFIVVPLLPTMSASYVSLVAGILVALVGLAAKPLIENAISGIVITLAQPVRINDTVIIDGKYGTIEKINLLYTTVRVWNWRRYLIPNHKLLQKEFENLSQGDEFEWAHITFYVAPGSDMEKVKSIAKSSMKCKFLSDSEPPSFWVMELNPDSILCWVAGWAKNPAEAWALKSATNRKLAFMLAEADIHFQLARSEVNLNSLNDRSHP
jgi:small-conductance mechanosensitive channel